MLVTSVTDFYWIWVSGSFTVTATHLFLSHYSWLRITMTWASSIQLWTGIVAHFQTHYSNHHIPLITVLFFCFFFLKKRTISCFCVNTVSRPVAHGYVTADTFLYLYIRMCIKHKVLLFLYEKFKIYMYVYIYLYIHIYALYSVLSSQIGFMNIFCLEIWGFKCLAARQEVKHMVWCPQAATCFVCLQMLSTVRSVAAREDEWHESCFKVKPKKIINLQLPPPLTGCCRMVIKSASYVLA